MESANYASYKNWTGESIISYMLIYTKFSINMHYVNIKIKTKNTVGVVKRIVIFLHCSFPLKCLGGRGTGVAL